MTDLGFHAPCPCKTSRAPDGGGRPAGARLPPPRPPRPWTDQLQGHRWDPLTAALPPYLCSNQTCVLLCSCPSPGCANGLATKAMVRQVLAGLRSHRLPATLAVHLQVLPGDTNPPGHSGVRLDRPRAQPGGARRREGGRRALLCQVGATFRITCSRRSMYEGDEEEEGKYHLITCTSVAHWQVTTQPWGEQGSTSFNKSWFSWAQL